MIGLPTLRWLSLAEGVSLLLLVFIAMPLKHAMGLPLAVRIVGMVHGVLFLALLSSAAQTFFARDLSGARVLRVLLLALVPFGFVWVERMLRAQMEKPVEPAPLR
jgi:integral membrane protein